MTDDASTPDSGDEIPVAELEAIDRQYLKASERRAGRVSRSAIHTRCATEEGRVLAELRRTGEPLLVRQHVNRPDGASLQTTSVIGVELGERTR